jgi:DNA-directed RNA polymerase sigma subunit (sigma70/sigma32)
VTESQDEATMREYLVDIARYPVLDHEEERRLLQAIERGATAQAELEALGRASASSVTRELREEVEEGREAQRTLTLSNLQLVVEIARTHPASGRSLLALVQAGNAGLPRGIETFASRTGLSFQDHLASAVRDAIASRAP